MLRPAPLALLLLLAGPAGAATVLSVGDGDTLRVVDGAKRLTIRMACIAMPPRRPRAPMAPLRGSACRSWPRSVRW
jgi:endonuclease YncB( thermonuclease family)